MVCDLAILLTLGLPLIAADPKPAVKVNARDGLTYVWIAAGSFAMGCSPGDAECFDWEPAAHKVTVARGFWIEQTEVTQRAYQRVMGTNSSMYKGANLPVEQIGWDDARAYCEAVGMRLPTEVEWEFAARGGSAAAQYGSLPAVAWFDDNGEARTHPVATKAPNGYGLYDTLGNVWEWVRDARGENQKILRGGSFFNLSQDLRVSNRLWATPDTRHRNLGIRCAGD